MDLIEHATMAVAAAFRGESPLPEELLVVEGMSSARNRHLLNRLCAFPECRYFEVGTWHASTILAASYRNPGSFVTVDDFSQFGGSEEAAGNRSRWSRDCRFEIHDADVWSLDPAIVGAVNLYFYDGGHSYDEHVLAFTHFDSAFEPEFIAVVDDWNWSQVRDGSHRAFDDLGYRILAKWELFSPANGDEASWWNGLLVAVIHKTRPQGPGRGQQPGSPGPLRGLGPSER